MLPDVTNGNKSLMIAEAAGANLEAVMAMLDQLSVEELEALNLRVQEVVKTKKALGTARG